MYGILSLVLVLASFAVAFACLRVSDRAAWLVSDAHAIDGAYHERMALIACAPAFAWLVGAFVAMATLHAA